MGEGVAENIVLVFDLEKVFETPKLSTNSAYYKRYLSTYNLCIHDETHNRSYMYIWHEGIASRGPGEISSCLLYHFTHFLPKECHHLILYSDSCGGQNRNIKMSVILSHFLENSQHLQSITQHFFRSGHSYNVCDRKFGLIEKKRKQVTNIYVPSQWKDLIASAKITLPKFQVIEMSRNDFYSCDELLLSFCTNRKKTTEKDSLSWFKIRKISYEKGQPLILYFETYEDVKVKYDESIEFKPNLKKVLNTTKKGFNKLDFGNFKTPLLYPNGRPIATTKRTDLIELLNFIPQKYHAFYLTLNHTEMEQVEEIVISSGDSDNEDK